MGVITYFQFYFALFVIPFLPAAAPLFLLNCTMLVAAIFISFCYLFISLFTAMVMFSRGYGCGWLDEEGFVNGGPSL